MKPDPSGSLTAHIPARSLYIHVPFCTSRCRYCDFFSTVDSGSNPGLVDATIDSTLRRAAELARRFGFPFSSTPGSSYSFDTVYVGGGTPTRLSPSQLRKLLVGIGEITSGCIQEWTVEANPESLTHEKLGILSAAGVTRLSLGVQSLDDEVLARLGRPCDSAKALGALELAVAAGFEVSADLLAAIPASRREPQLASEVGNLAAEVAHLLDMGLKHISIYDLIVEEGTQIAANIARGSLVPASEDFAADQRDEAEALLSGWGFERYEISNYAIPGHECLHNLAYWRMDSWIGAGPGAVSTIGFTARESDPWSDLATADAGLRAVTPGGALRITEWPDLGSRDLPGREEAISPRDAAFDTMMMAFRTARGLDTDAFLRRFGYAPQALAGRTIQRWKERFRKTGNGFLALDEKGMDLSNRFLSDCLLELEENQGER